ncbi:MAG: hypothetical protein R3C53_09895 [Pirellulaceae bacterium]
MNAETFEIQMRARLASRWNCSEPRGFSQESILAGLHFTDMRIPQIYERFLRICGADAGSLFFDYEWSLASREARNSELDLQLTEYEIEKPKGFFTFLDFMGDYFWGFCDDEEDPHVLMFDQLQFADLSLRLSDFLTRWEQLETP